jgi:uncharacterized membrane protein
MFTILTMDFGGVLLMEIIALVLLVLLLVSVGAIVVIYVGLELLSRFVARESRRNLYAREKDFLEH